MKKSKNLFKSLIPQSVKLRMHILIARIMHRVVIFRIRRKVRRGGKVTVLFLSSENAKWKCQSLYDLMRDSQLFNPIIGIMRQDVDVVDDKMKIRKNIESAENFFSNLGCAVVNVYDIDRLEYKKLRVFSPDIIFYQQPWSVFGHMLPRRVLKYALPCYVPYYVPNYVFPDLSYKVQSFHPYLAYYFVLNDFERKQGLSLRKRFNFSGTLITTGHPMLDEFFLHPIDEPSKTCVIYAPHFTFAHPNNKCVVHYSTFLDYGEYILEYAKQHLEMNWVFKPHPLLKTALIKSGAWSLKKVDEYYAEWGKLGRIHESGEYVSLFREATTMITDCGSFLTEFAVTGQPIIHLINADNKLEAMPLYSTYYKVYNKDELKEELCEVLERENDINKVERLQYIKDANLCGQYAAKNIISFLSKELRGVTD